MNNFFTRSELELITAPGRMPRVSILMPTHRQAGSEQDPIRFRNLLGKAEKSLAEGRVEGERADEILDPIRRLTNDAAFWLHRTEGLAVYSAPGLFRTYDFDFELPEFAKAGEMFHLKACLAACDANQRFYLLTISNHAARFFEGDRYSLHERTLFGLPKGEADLDDTQSKKRIPSLDPITHRDELDHGVIETAGTRGRPFLSTQGPSGAEPWTKGSTRDLAARLDAELNRNLTDRNPPLVVAGVDYLVTWFADATKYPNLFREGIVGNPEGLSEQELHRKAWSMIALTMNRQRDDDLARFDELIAKNRASTNLADVLGAAHDGRIDVLFAASDRDIWGRFDSASRKMQLDDVAAFTNYDLIDLAAVATALRSGRVHLMRNAEIPGETPIAALYRW